MFWVMVEKSPLVLALNSLMEKGNWLSMLLSVAVSVSRVLKLERMVLPV